MRLRQILLCTLFALSLEARAEVIGYEPVDAKPNSVQSISKLAPRFLVILDPGHGGEDTGAIAKLSGARVFEKDITLSIAKQTALILSKRGIHAVLTRPDDSFIALDKRADLANKEGALAKSAVFVSIHANSSDEPHSSGAETYVFNAASNDASRRLADLENGKRWTQNHATLDLIMADLASTANYAQSVNLACAVQNSVVDGLVRNHQTIRNRGIRQALFYVLMQTQMPGILFEPGFMSNFQDLKRLVDPMFQQNLARTLADGIFRWRVRLAHASRHKKFRAISAVKKNCIPLHD